MPVNFPNSPSNDDEHSANGLVYKYNSAKGAWKRKFVAPTDATDINQLNDSSGLLTSSSTTVVADMAALIALTGMSSGDQAYITANNKLYFYNGSGWYLIATVQNDAPSAITGVDGSYELAIDGTATTITAASTDPEGFPLTWSYSTSGLGSIATVSNTDNVFTITPSTTEADAGTFTLTINATDGINGAVNASTNLTLEFIVRVTNSNYTTLLATAVDTSDNNNITDSSTNSHTITVNGDAYAGTFSPYRSGGYSLKFNGTANNYIRVPSWPRSNLGTNDFTVECFVYPTNDSSRICDLLPGSAGLFRFSTWTGGNLALDINKQGVGAYDIRTTGGNINYNAWNHVAVCRSGTSLKLYSNGSLIHTESGGDWDYGTGDAYSNIGRWNTTGDVLNGYISNFRVKNSALYTGSTYNVPTEGFTSDAGTTLLVGAGAVIDNVTPYGVEMYGVVTSEPFSPFDYVEYSATDHGGSVYFDGSGDYILGNSGTNLGTGNWTVEGWMYITTTTASQMFIDFRPFTNGDYVSLKFETADSKIYFISGNANRIASDDLIAANSWVFISLVRDAGTIKMYINGKVQTQTYASTANYLSNSARPILGINGDNGTADTMYGYISDVRVTIGTAHYTADFTPPTAPLSSSGAELHIKGTDASIIDKSQVNNIKMNGPTTGSTTKTFVVSEPTISFASGSNTDRYLNFDPTVLDFMEILGNPSIPFTIEGIWGWQGSTASPIFEIFQDTNNFFYFGGGPGGTQSGITTDNNLYAIFKIGGVERFKMTAGIGSYNNVGSSFKHQAITRNSSGLMQHYYDGQLRPTTITHSGSDTVSWTSPVGYIGRSDWMGIYGRYEGYIHQVRLTVGLARYTANFTPPTASLEG